MSIPVFLLMSARKGSHWALRFCEDSVEMMPKFNCWAGSATDTPQNAAPAMREAARPLRTDVNISILQKLVRRGLAVTPQPVRIGEGDGCASPQPEAEAMHPDHHRRAGSERAQSAH